MLEHRVLGNILNGEYVHTAGYSGTFKFGSEVRKDKITRDAGTNMMGSLNPKTKDGERLFNIVTDITHHVDSQFRNYVERSVSTLNKFIRQAVVSTGMKASPL